ncbi:MAG: hypothetical protein KGL39_17820 [Patescibacteria group bacterium]|nr:hypothetical protein [Patescibacteria group bacterium]
MIGEIARKKDAAPGMKNYHGERKEHEGKREEKNEPKRERREHESLHDYHGHNRLKGK